ncbi:MAG: SpoIIE family protein phosphatase [Paludisphaera borealis]|uniref:SpoIIE family protein phosphatase n=1 Tax=Paludisphaera borealis TaxID=1387353 RepID=UPI002850672B|nr:SpoIIE family protein phosphatase [Paludisphaera borealis]MDR3620846.1 SpoIIE family protein phosphatase [Paludisphaera borealis]
MVREQEKVPILQVVVGPNTGRVFRLDRELTLIGRNQDCDVVLEPKSVSRRHAEVVRRNGDFLIRDLDSTRGTIVNGERLSHPIALHNGASVVIGEVTLRYHSQAVQIQAGEDDQSTVFAAIDLTARNDRAIPIVKPEEKLRALQQISQVFGGTLVLNELLDRVLGSLFDIFPRASGGFVLLVDAVTGALTPEVVKARNGPTSEVTISKTILERVLDDGLAILSKNVPAEFAESKSVSESRVRSLMCVPIVDQKQKPIGVVQIDADDGRGKFDEEDLDLLAAVASQISVAVQNAQLHRDLFKQREIERELQFARQVMQALLPERPKSVSGYEFWDCYEPARHVGGDYYGFIPMFGPTDDRAAPPKRWAIAVGDVVGKGLPAALLTARLSAEISLFLQGETDPAAVVTKLNRRLDENGVLDMYITFLLVMLDVETHTLQIVNAGHPLPLIRRADGTLHEVDREHSGLPLAIDGGSVYTAYKTTLAPGEYVTLYTDGVTDALSPDNVRYTEDRLRDLLTQTPGAPHEAGEMVVEKVREHVAGRAQFDDITLVVFGRV